MNDLAFLFAVHNHQPVGNFPEIFKAAFNDCYRPLLEALAGHPGFRFALHFSGPLWEYMEKTERGCWDLVHELSVRGQVELLGGGFYEPVLSIIPEEDRLGQIRMMNDFLAENFGQRPRGLWLTERVWEPDLPRTLAAAGIEFTLLDEEHFHYAGVRDLHTTYITESEGRSLRVFPIDKTLRYYIPFHSLEDVESYLGTIREAGGTAILGDDGEKFGVWPGTHKWVFEDGWLERFLAFVEDRKIRMMSFAEYLDGHPPSGRVYLPPASYEEMMEWVLEPDEQAAFQRLKADAGPEARRFLRGGFFRDFCRKYPEANHLHKRMIMVSREVRAAGNPGDGLRQVYKGQCNDPYWHGVFGGLYLPHLREAAYGHLLEAEKTTPDPPGWKVLDYDCDGRDELAYRDPTFGLMAKPAAGGTLIEIDYRPWSRNLTDVLSRRREAYHHAAESAGEGSESGKSIHELDKKLPPDAAELMRYDRHPRFSMIDHFFRAGTTPDDFRRVDFGEQGDFVDGAFSFEASGGELRLERRGMVRAGEERVPLVIRKTVAASDGSLRIDIEVENLSGRPLDVTYGSEWNFLAFPHEIELLGADGAALYGRALRFEPSAADAVWTFALRTLSQSEEGFDIIHQGYCLCPVWSLGWAGNGTKRLSVVLKEHNGR
ncbi:MAG: alpha-amylase/4-alpha-glucanotransferase domain-containing protein [Candidatus Aminicenantales bacterium]